MCTPVQPYGASVNGTCGSLQRFNIEDESGLVSQARLAREGRMLLMRIGRRHPDARQEPLASTASPYHPLVSLPFNVIPWLFPRSPWRPLQALTARPVVGVPNALVRSGVRQRSAKGGSDQHVCASVQCRVLRAAQYHECKPAPLPIMTHTCGMLCEV